MIVRKIATWIPISVEVWLWFARRRRAAHPVRGLVAGDLHWWHVRCFIRDAGSVSEPVEVVAIQHDADEVRVVVWHEGYEQCRAMPFDHPLELAEPSPVYVPTNWDDREESE